MLPTNNNHSREAYEFERTKKQEGVESMFEIELLIANQADQELFNIVFTTIPPRHVFLSLKSLADDIKCPEVIESRGYDKYRLKFNNTCTSASIIRLDYTISNKIS